MARTNIIKYVHIFFNCILCISGVVLMGMSIHAINSDSFKNKLSGHFRDKTDTETEKLPLDQLKTVFYILAAVGGLIFFTGLLACIGACCESKLLLTICFIIVLILFIAKLGTAIAFFLAQDTLKSEMKSKLYDLSIKARDNKDLHNWLYRLEDEFDCCVGQRSLSTCGGDLILNGSLWRPNCTDEIFNLIKKNGLIVAGILFGVLFIELLSMVFTCCLRKKMSGFM